MVVKRNLYFVNKGKSVLNFKKTTTKFYYQNNYNNYKFTARVYTNGH